MKKIYLCALALSTGFMSFGQGIKAKKFEKNILETPKIANDYSNQGESNYMLKKTDSDTIWSENFDNGIPTGWSLQDNTGNNFVWKIHNGPLDESDYVNANTNLLDTSAGNFMLLPIDFYNSQLSESIEMDSWFQTAAIAGDFSKGVTVVFKHDFRRCCLIYNAETVISVSTTADFADAQEFDIIQGVGTNERFNDVTSVNVTGAIPSGYTGDIYLRFYVKNRTVAYWWAVDDIALVTSAANDLTTAAGSANFFGVEYTRIPKTQVQPMNAFITASNIGSTDQTGSKLTVTVNNGTPTFEEVIEAGTIPSLMLNDTISKDSIWTPGTTVGSEYTVTLTVSSDSVDITPENNTTVMTPFQITEGIMALDNYTTSPTSSGADEEYEIGNQFDCTVDQDLYGIEVVTGTGTAVGTFVEAKLYLVGISEDGSQYTYTSIWSGSHEVQSADIGTAFTFYNTDGSAIAGLESGQTYVAAIHAYNSVSGGYEYAVGGTGPAANSNTATHARLAYPTIGTPNAGESYVSSSIPMIRLDFIQGLVGIEEGRAAVNFSVYPNPSNGEFTINLTKEVKTAAISVRNVIGQTVFNKTVNVAGRTKETISLTDYSKGVYFLTVNDETVKLIVE